MKKKTFGIQYVSVELFSKQLSGASLIKLYAHPSGI